MRFSSLDAQLSAIVPQIVQLETFDRNQLLLSLSNIVFINRKIKIINTMTKCFNPDCLHENPSNNNFCQKCGQKLLLTERYRGIKYLGEGGFGRTFIGIDQNRRNSYCVIKQFLPLSQGSDALQKCIQLFEQEAELLEKLGKHPQIPDLLAFFEQDNKLYLIQEYIEGQDLLTELEQDGKFSESKIKLFLLEMLPVLDFIHQKAVIHRDIKPENIIRRKDKPDPAIYGEISNLVLIDFGVSKQISATIMTRIGTGVGTLGYAPPEQSRGIVHFSSDIYSLGVTAIRLLTGVFPEERNGIIIDDIFDLYNLSWTWKEWFEKNDLSINNDLAEILDRMLADKVGDRFQTAREVLDALNFTPNISQNSYPQVSHQYKIEVTRSSQPSQIQPQPKNNLQTSNANFTKLDQLLATGKWQEADQETSRIMCQIMGREKEGWLTVNSCKNFPVEELKIIDDLWIKYSQGKFGFSIQQNIWIDCGGIIGQYNQSVYGKFAKIVGWRNKWNWFSYSDLIFDLNVPFLGHLPSGGFGIWVNGLSKVGGVISFISFRL